MGNLDMGNWAMVVLGAENLGLVGLRRPRKLPTASPTQLLQLKALQIMAPQIMAPQIKLLQIKAHCPATARP